jgi:hypothetical protein
MATSWPRMLLRSRCFKLREIKNTNTGPETHVWPKHLNNILPRLVSKQPSDILFGRDKISSNSKLSYFSVQWAVFLLTAVNHFCVSKCLLVSNILQND